MYSHHYIAFRLVKFVLGQLKVSRSWMKKRLDCFNHMQRKVKFKGLLWSSEIRYHYKYSLTDWSFLCTWVRASWIEFNNFPTRCDLFNLLLFCRQLYMFRVLTLIIRSRYNCKYSFWYWLTGSTIICSRCWVGTDSCVSYGRYTYRTMGVKTRNM